MRASLRSYLFACSGYALLTFLLLLPVFGRFRTAIPGGEVAAIDGWQHVWHVWWSHWAISRGENPLVTGLLLYPEGVDLGVHPLNLSNGLLALPVTALAGPIAGYNVAVLLAFILCGIGGYWLAQEAGAQPGAAFLAGLALSFGPYHLTKLWDGQLELIALQWLPLYAASLLRTRRSGAIGPLIGAGVLLALIGYTSLYYLLFIAVYSLAFVLLWMPLAEGRRALLGWFVRAAGIAAIGAALMTPLLISIVGSAELVGSTERVNPLLLARSANLLDFFLPSYLHPLWGDAVATLGPRWHPGISAWNVALGYTALGLALIACVRRPVAARRWLAIALIGMLLALGPQLRIGDWDSGIPLPYRALLELPGFSIGQRPGHFVVVTLLALVPLIALGIDALRAALPPSRARLLLGGLAVLFAIEYLVPPPPVQAQVVTAQALALREGSGAIFVLPDQKGQIRSLQDQLIHQRPIVGGFLARIGERPLIAQTPPLRDVLELQAISDQLILPPDSDPSLLLRAYGFSQLLAEWEFMSDEQQAMARQAIADLLPGSAPGFSSPQAAIYDLPAAPVQPFAFFGDGWYRAESDGTRRWRWMSDTAVISLVNPTDQVQSITLNLTGESYRLDRRLELRLGEHPLGIWQVAAPPARSTRALHLWLPPGRHNLHLRAPSEPVAPHGPISIALTQIAIR